VKHQHNSNAATLNYQQSHYLIKRYKKSRRRRWLATSFNWRETPLQITTTKTIQPITFSSTLRLKLQVFSSS